MKLAEALLEKAEYDKKLLALINDITASSTRYDDEDTSSDNEAIEAINEYIITSIGQGALRAAIDMTNASTMVGDKTLAQLICKRNAYSSIVTKLGQVLEAVRRETKGRYSRDELKTLANVNVAEVKALHAEYAAKYNEVNVLIQQTNWNTDLLD